MNVYQEAMKFLKKEKIDDIEVLKLSKLFDKWYKQGRCDGYNYAGQLLFLDNILSEEKISHYNFSIEQLED